MKRNAGNDNVELEVPPVLVNRLTDQVAYTEL